jgi:hypothetical protein
MSMAIWGWILFLLWTILGVYFTWGASPPQPPNRAIWIGYGGGIVFWLLVLIICWSTFGPPLR